MCTCKLILSEKQERNAWEPCTKSNKYISGELGGKGGSQSSNVEISCTLATDSVCILHEVRYENRFFFSLKH